ncbi:hypothetical protein TRAPUB_3156 [Trametes pubescens]|uniref:Uncharacterized protein n=1 Tax=Trametes pubescens TaxID=154538 RepID=A0A1M2VEC6_TRAPU|nr:hypothetical protein TRAPUB_3156 [Trametes pubescens]
MRRLLRAIYDGRGYVPLPSPPTSTASSFKFTPRYLRDMSPYVPFALISALMRLGHKYKLKDIVDDAAQHLEDYFTTDFGTWLQYCNGDTGTTFDFSDDEGADIFEAVNLARLTHKFSILPLALYKCCQYDLAEFVFGIEREASGDVVYLGQDDVERCVRARERLLRESCQMAQTIGSATSSPHCEAPHVCPRQLESLHKTSTSMLAGLINTDALSGFREQLGMVTGFVQWMELCYECWEGLAFQHELKQRETWGSSWIYWIWRTRI